MIPWFCGARGWLMRIIIVQYSMFCSDCLCVAYAYVTVMQPLYKKLIFFELRYAHDIL